MSNTNKLVVIIAIILIIVCVIVGNNKTQELDNIINDSANKITKEVAYNTVKNEITGSEEYVVYDKQSGEEITRVEEYQLKIYEINPNYEELPVKSQDEQSGIVE